MTELDISNAIKERLSDLGPLDLPVTWPGQDVTGVKPYVFVQIVRVGRSDRTMDASKTESQGRLLMTVVTRQGRQEREGLTYAQALADIFPMGLRLAITDGRIVVTKPADIREGFLEDGDWRTLVTVDYTAN